MPFFWSADGRCSHHEPRTELPVSPAPLRIATCMSQCAGQQTIFGASALAEAASTPFVTVIQCTRSPSIITHISVYTLLREKQCGDSSSAAEALERKSQPEDECPMVIPLISTQQTL